jgi:hypothetical protein
VIHSAGPGQLAIGQPGPQLSQGPGPWCWPRLVHRTLGLLGQAASQALGVAGAGLNRSPLQGRKAGAASESSSGAADRGRKLRSSFPDRWLQPLAGCRVDRCSPGRWWIVLNAAGGGEASGEDRRVVTLTRAAGQGGSHQGRCSGPLTPKLLQTSPGGRSCSVLARLGGEGLILPELGVRMVLLGPGFQAGGQRPTRPGLVHSGSIERQRISRLQLIGDWHHRIRCAADPRGAHGIAQRI